MGPLIEPPTGKLARALTSLEPGETLAGRAEAARRHRPAVVARSEGRCRAGVVPPPHRVLRSGARHHARRHLDEALRCRTPPPFGLTGGLHSLDDDEIEQWLDAVQVGNAYVNRHITGAIVQRQPFGGWKDSVVGPGRQGGRTELRRPARHMGAGAAAGRARGTRRARVRQALADYIELLPSDSDRDWLLAAAGSDAAAWAGELGQEIDRTGLAVESNVLRYRPLPAVTVRAGRGASAVELMRVLLAAELVGTPARVSLDPAVASVLGLLDAPMDGSAPAGVRRLHRVIDARRDRGGVRRACRSGAVTGRVRVRRRRGGGSAARVGRRGCHRAGRTCARDRSPRAAHRVARAGGLAHAAPLRPPPTSTGRVSVSRCRACRAPDARRRRWRP